MKKIIALLLSLTLCLCLFAGCGKSAPSAPAAPADPSAPAAPAAPAEPADDGKVYTINIDFPNPETAVGYKVLVEWEKYIEEQSNGRIDVKVYSGGALGALPDCVTNCLSGITDGFWSGVTIYPGVFPGTEVMGLPMMGAKNFDVVNKVLNDLLENYPVISAEWEDLYVVTLHSSTGSPILFKDEIGTIEGMAGYNLRLSNAYTSTWLASKGANPVSCGINDGYEAISKGVIDGGLFFFDQVQSSALHEVIDSIYVGETIYPLNMLCLNKDVYESLPADLQAVIDESGEFFLEKSIQFFEEQKAMLIDVLEEAGVNIIYETEESREFLAKDAEQAWALWVEKMNEYDYDGQAILDTALELIEKYNAEVE